MHDDPYKQDTIMQKKARCPNPPKAQLKISYYACLRHNLEGGDLALKCHASSRCTGPDIHFRMPSTGTPPSLWLRMACL